MTDQSNDGAWFAEKRFGYGAALPLTWQGWTIMFGYLVAILLLGKRVYP